MELPYSSYSPPSSSSTTYFSKKPKIPTQPFHSSSLHTVRKSVAKPWKKPVAPLPPTPPRIYKVDPINFRDVVQKLTGAVELDRSVAPPPLEVGSKSTFCAVEYQQDFAPGALERKQGQKVSTENKEATLSLGMNMSPSSQNWFSFPLFSPGSLSTLEHSTVL
ncbi:hypothetical protein I3843_01G002300 [Carya illinoinensis]|uniref:VQ domain-containing protein n=1 Tax=Carya illinoinensis TaxID=32201 RepID=A0A8T1RHB8_CARIL|nr:uncharacterized protein LOC122293042 [Carya illinoinensis]KAG2724103.1 hypothetical protein I3760_01G002400 [Carya illinoinensis]KAG6666035.1 hypothetical protein CIPAW_01G002700 [Carya illinoinensis]KAG6728929.1 hypothetical protein I3842_01G002000 [Carya illinoinensis]KAG7993391.1 hypothetical protein I3843_01G002300 [Carya illinoinensis]